MDIFTSYVGWKHASCLVLKQLTSFTSAGEASTIGALGLQRGVGGLPNHSLGDPALMGRHGGGGPDFAPNGRGINYGFQPPVDAISRPGPETALLPPDASPTLYIEGLPSDCTRREVARILFVMTQSFWILSSCFRLWLLNFIYFNSVIHLFLNIVFRYFPPFCWIQRSETCQQRGQTCKSIVCNRWLLACIIAKISPLCWTACFLQRGDPLILCFVDFANPACAATALSALQGIISI